VGWEHFQKADFDRLRAEYGVNWIVVERPRAPDLSCPYQNDAVLVCRIE
jgi:hypothetical protein